jgi:flavodoxin
MTGVTSWRFSMKTLVIFYSRSGKTKKVAEAISEILKCDKEEIFDIKSREGVVGFLSAGTDTPIRTYLSLYKEDFKNVAFFCTRLGSDAEKVFADMKNLSQKTPIALLKLTSREVVRDQYMQKVKEFIKNLKEEIVK